MEPIGILRFKNKSVGKHLTTRLTDDEEVAFQNWYDLAAKLHGWAYDPDEKEHYYDYRGYWKNTPISERLINQLATSHLPDTWKRPGHPSYSNESIYKPIKVTRKSSRKSKEDVAKLLKGWSQEDIDYLYNEASKTNWSPDGVLYAMKTESGYNPHVKNKVSSAIGLVQLIKKNLQKMYPDTWEDVYNQYTSGTRSKKDAIDDAMSHIKALDKHVTTERNNLNYGRLKINLLAPNKGLDDTITNSTYNSLTDSMKKMVTVGETTYRDLMQLYDDDFNKKW